MLLRHTGRQNTHTHKIKINESKINKTTRIHENAPLFKPLNAKCYQGMAPVPAVIVTWKEVKIKDLTAVLTQGESDLRYSSCL